VKPYALPPDPDDNVTEMVRVEATPEVLTTLVILGKQPELKVKDWKVEVWAVKGVDPQVPEIFNFAKYVSELKMT
jgi:hypothetical protein